MSAILVQWKDDLRLVEYEPSKTVGEFLNDYFYLFEDHLLNPDAFKPCGYFSWNGKVLTEDLNMENYPFEDDDILTYHDEPYQRVEVTMNIRGSPRIYALRFDSFTTVGDIKRDLLSHAELSLPIERIQMSYQSTQLLEDSWTLAQYDVAPGALIRAKEIPEAVARYLKHDITRIRFIQDGKTVDSIYACPVDNLVIEISYRNLDGFSDGIHYLSAAVVGVEGSVPLIEVSSTFTPSCIFVMYKVDQKLPFSTIYELQIMSSNPNYSENNTRFLEFSTRSEFGHLHFEWDSLNLAWIDTPTSASIPIVHSLLHLMRRQLTCSKMDTSLLQLIGSLKVVYHTRNPFEKPLEVEYNIVEDIQEELNLTHFEEGCNIHIYVIDEELPPLEDLNISQIAENVQSEPAMEATAAPASAADLSPNPTPTAIETEDLQTITADVSMPDNQVDIASDATINVRVAWNSADDDCNQTDDIQLEERDVSTREVVMSENIAQETVDMHEAAVDMLCAVVAAEEESTTPSEAEEILSERGNDTDIDPYNVDVGVTVDANAELISTRQTSDGTESVLEYIDDGFIVLMPVDPMDTSIMIAEENQIADIVVKSDTR